MIVTRPRWWEINPALLSAAAARLTDGRVVPSMTAKNSCISVERTAVDAVADHEQPSRCTLLDAVDAVARSACDAIVMKASAYLRTAV